MFEKNKVNIDGNGNIVIQDASGATITINPDNNEELRKFLTEFSNELSNLPLRVTELLEEKSKHMKNEIEIGANLYFTYYANINDISSGKVNSLTWGTTITNLTREIRYFNQPYFKVHPKFEIKDGVEHDTFQTSIMNGTKYPHRLEFGQVITSTYEIRDIDFYEKITTKDSEAFIQAFVTTTVGEIYSSRKYPLLKFIEDAKNLLKK